MLRTAHPLALWLKKNGYRADQVQAFLPGPMATATAMYHSGRNPLEAIKRDEGERVTTVKTPKQRRLHKAFLRYHDADNWPMLREALVRMNRRDLIGPGKDQLVPWQQPASWSPKVHGRDERSLQGRRDAGARSQPTKGTILTQHTGLPPRDDGTRARRSEMSGPPGPRARADSGRGSRSPMVESRVDGAPRSRRR